MTHRDQPLGSTWGAASLRRVPFRRQQFLPHELAVSTVFGDSDARLPASLPNNGHGPYTARRRPGESVLAGRALDAAELGVQEVAEAVAEEVEAEDAGHDGGAREERQPRGLLEVEASLREDIAP